MSLLTKLSHIWFLLSRPMTLGVRVAAINRAGEIMLVRHTYVSGWHLPGGGVDVGENCIDAAIRELAEETGLEAQTAPQLFNIYFNRMASKRDHVALYRCEATSNSSPKIPDREIAEARFFSLNDLPQDLTDATARRLAEMYDGATVSPYW